MPETSPSDAELLARALTRAAALLRDANRLESRQERRRRHRLARMIEDPRGVQFSLALTDEVARIRDDRRAADRFVALAAASTGTAYLGPFDRAGFAIATRIARRIPRVVMALVRERLRRESAGVILPAADPAFGRHLADQRARGVRVNINVLGEAILGERHALDRLDQIEQRLRRDDVDYISVKISGISSRVDPMAFDETVATVAARLRRLYDVGLASSTPKFVNLDMEEYRDLRLTAAVFMTVLDEPEYRGLDAGIVLQAYLPDSHAVLHELCEFARARRAAGGGRIKVRIVKGANLAMERVEAELRGWPAAPFATKADVDASYKRMLEFALQPEYSDAVRLGVASHNLFEVAWALVVAEAMDASHRVEVEMLEGMADASADAVRDDVGHVLLYEPIVGADEFEAAIAYLARRLEENAAPDNFLRSYLARGADDALVRERERFVAAVHDRHALDLASHRVQDRTAATTPTPPDARFRNEPDTDWTQVANRNWIDVELEAAPRAASAPPRVTRPQVDATVRHARDAQSEWSALAPGDRRALLHAVGDEIAANRGRIIATMVAEGSKVVREADVEVSEAIDFAHYYAGQIDAIASRSRPGTEFTPYGTVVVAAPWNFPFAIPAGGVLAALAAGNTVILKPATETVEIGHLVAQCCWNAGVPRDIVQFLPCRDDMAGRHLITHPDVDAVILTGAYETARMFLDWKPDLRLFAETSGKNAIVITASADLDLAIHDLVQSAFGHAGQKCSAASLAIVEASVYDEDDFRDRLADAVASLRVGPAHERTTDVPPLIRPASGPLARALETLDDGETWLVEPKALGDDGRTWSPGVRLGVQPGSWFHLTECFGPVLGVMRAPDLATAIDWQNQPMFGLTGGIHSLDRSEIVAWLARVEVGNAYVNRGVTGAIVQRQPFGGWKRSAVGATAKAGGPGYVATLGRWTGDRFHTDFAAALAALGPEWERMTWGVDPTGLRYERNVLRFRPRGAVLLRVGDNVTDDEITFTLAAARATGTTAVVSSARRWETATSDAVTVEDDIAFADRMGSLGISRLRLLGTANGTVRTRAAKAAITVDDHPVVFDAAIELARWGREQAVSRTTHRYGHVTD